MKVGKVLLIMAMAPTALLAQSTSTSDISGTVDGEGSGKKQKVERIEVTGSLIKKVDVEGPQPVQTLDREYLDRAGYNSVSDVLRDLSANSFGSAREQSGSTTAGVSSVNLRGLGANRTLVLVNGRRVVKDGIAGVVDLNLIPMAAVERMDVLKDSSSATYGSDAIGGVINIITKKDFDGAEFSMRHENAEFQGGNRTTVSGTFGKSTSKGNAMMTMQYRKNSKLYSKDRPWSKEGSSANSPNPNINTGNGDGYKSDGNCTSGKIDEFGLCRFNFAEYSTETPEIQQFNVFTNGRYELNDTTELYGQANYTRKETNWQYAPGVVQYRGANRLKSDYIAGKVDDYDASRGVDFLWRSLALGNRVSEIQEDSYGVTVGTRKFVGDSWEVDAHVSAERIKRNDMSVGGYANKDNMKRDLLSGKCDWLTKGGTCEFGDDVAYNPYEIMKSEQTSADVRASGELFELNSGVVAMAVGVQGSYEKFSDELDPLQQQGKVTGGGAGSTGAGDRTVGAVFTEFAVPVTEKLELQISGRYDNYSDFGDTVNPALSMKYKPIDQVLLRGSASTGFKAPDMVDLYQNASEGNPTFTDTVGCKTNAQACGDQQHTVVTDGNEGLREEKSKSISIGAVVEPVKNFNFSVDFFHVEMENVVGIDYQGLADAEAAGKDLGQYGTVFHRDGDGLIESVDTQLLNLGQRKVAGYDFGFETSGLTKIGTFGFSNKTTYLIRYDENSFPGNALESQLQSFGAPKWRNNIGFDYAPTDNLGFLVNLNTTGSHYKSDSTDGKLERYTQVDAQVAYNFRKLQAKLTVGGRNIMGTTPPLNTSDTNNQLDGSLYNPIGRRFFAAYNQSF